MRWRGIVADEKFDGTNRPNNPKFTITSPRAAGNRIGVAMECAKAGEKGAA